MADNENTILTEENESTRIINLSEASEMDAGMYFVTDSSNGTRKVPITKLIDADLENEYAAAPAKEVGDLKEEIEQIGSGVSTSVRNAIYTLLANSAYATIGLDDELETVQSWASEVTAITLSQSTATITGFGTVQLTATTVPAGGAITWTSSDSTIAAVEDGLVASVANGTAIITATSGSKSATCNVTVSGIATITGITATYTQSGTIYQTASLSDLISDLVVVANYSDSSTVTLTSDQYELSGTLTVGTSTITVTYGSYSDTFNVTVSRVDNSIYNWDFTTSLIDSKQGAEATLGAAVTQSASGLSWTTGNGAYVYLADMASYASTQFTIEIDITSVLLNTGASNKLINLTNSSTGVNAYGLYNRGTWRAEDAVGTYAPTEGDIADIGYFNGTTLKLQIDYAHKKWYLYRDETLVGTYATGFARSNGRNYVFIGAYDSTAGLLTGSVITGARLYEGLA